MENKDLIKAINETDETDNERMDGFLACGSDDYCDLCVGICMPQYH